MLTELNKILGPDLYESKVISLLSQSSTEDKQAWVSSTITKSLVTSITGLILMKLDEDVVSEDSTDATAIKAAKRAGFITAMKQVLEEIESLNQ